MSPIVLRGAIYKHNNIIIIKDPDSLLQISYQEYMEKFIPE